MAETAEPIDRSTRPYLLRAIYEWALDHRLTPQVLVDAGVPGVAVPAECIRGGRVVLTLHPRSVRDLKMGNDCLQFSARFGGKPFEVCLPVAAVSAIYCRENGRGIAFPEAHEDDDEARPARRNPNAAARRNPNVAAAPHLKLVK